MSLITYLHGVPRIVWEESEVVKMIYTEKLQYAVIEKFSYGMQRLGSYEGSSQQCELKGDCNSVLEMRHVLIRASNMEYYMKLLSKSIIYLLINSETIQ